MKENKQEILRKHNTISNVLVGIFLLLAIIRYTFFNKYTVILFFSYFGMLFAYLFYVNHFLNFDISIRLPLTWKWSYRQGNKGRKLWSVILVCCTLFWILLTILVIIMSDRIF